jgi:hypothetical protein
MSTSFASYASLPTTVRYSMERPGIKMIKLPKSLTPSSIHIPQSNRSLATSPSTADFTLDPDRPLKTPTGFTYLPQETQDPDCLTGMSDEERGIFSRTRVTSRSRGDQAEASGADETQGSIPQARSRCRKTLTQNTADKRRGGIDLFI